MNRQSVKSFFVRSYTRLISLTHPIQKKVLFSSFGGAQYSDNPRAISEKLHELFPEYEISWVINNRDDKADVVPEYVNIVSGGKWNFFYELATSFCFVTNTPIGISFYKRKKQFFIQTWHGDRGLKKTLYDTDPEGTGMSPVMDNKLTDLAICGSDFGEKVYRTAFRYHGRILKTGMPRNDVLLQNNTKIRQKIMQLYGVPHNVKILLYAPTFRDFQNKKQNVGIDIQETICKLESATKENWVCFVRSHYISPGLSIECDDRRIINVSNYPDMADLLACVDMLITDYSSSAGDYILRKKPVILAMFDVEEFKDTCRDFYFEPEKAGYIVAKNQIELNTIIDTFAEEDYLSSCKRIFEYYQTIETGNSAEEICKIINGEYCTRLKNRK